MSELHEFDNIIKGLSPRYDRQQATRRTHAHIQRRAQKMYPHIAMPSATGNIAFSAVLNAHLARLDSDAQLMNYNFGLISDDVYSQAVQKEENANAYHETFSQIYIGLRDNLRGQRLHSETPNLSRAIAQVGIGMTLELTLNRNVTDAQRNGLIDFTGYVLGTMGEEAALHFQGLPPANPYL